MFEPKTTQKFVALFHLTPAKAEWGDLPLWNKTLPLPGCFKKIPSKKLDFHSYLAVTSSPDPSVSGDPGLPCPHSSNETSFSLLALITSEETLKLVRVSLMSSDYAVT